MARTELEAFARGLKLTAIEAETLDEIVGGIVARETAASHASASQGTLDFLQGDGAAEPAAPPSAAPERYSDRGLIGEGGMGEVRRVFDRELRRTVARKTLHPALVARPRSLARFVEEAQATAQLQHPNIVPVHDIGVEPDGRMWFTMLEVRGRPLSEVIEAVHGGKAGPGWTVRRLVSALHRICQGVGYAHERGLVHRDLKPDNAMIGDHGEVYVVDWGLAKVLGAGSDEAEGAVMTDRAASDSFATRMGAVSGTPMYMSPEQARGQTAAADARSDVYGLGAILFEVLTGELPFEGLTVGEILDQVSRGQTRPMAPDPQRPDALVGICRRAMALDPADRFADAAELAEEIGAWLDGARLREQALGLLDKALEHGPAADRMRAEAIALEERAAELLAGVHSWSPADEKVAAWTLQDRARGLRDAAALEDLSVEQGLQAALRLDAGLAEGHAALAERFLGEHAEAEARWRESEAAQAEARIRTHAQALPTDHPLRIRCLTYLKGDGALSLRTEPPGAAVRLFRFETRNRRPVPELVGEYRAPLDRLPLAMGSYLCELSAPGRHTVRYPVHLPRGHHWDGVGPAGTEPVPVWLPDEGSVAEDESYVPAGWFRAGGSKHGDGAIPVQTLWCDAFVMQRFVVTNADYLVFLNDLVDQGREDEAMRWAPRERGGSHDLDGAMNYVRDQRGRFGLGEDPEGDAWLPQYPVLNVHIGCCHAYASWLAERTGQPWRLPGEFEWEKAGRGVDGRTYPWGSYGEPSWSHNRESQPGRGLPAEVGGYPMDCSVYGVRGLAGNIREWCADPWDLNGASIDGGRVMPVNLTAPVDLSAEARRVVKGGRWDGPVSVGACANRFYCEPGWRFVVLGFRLARDVNRVRRRL